MFKNPFSFRGRIRRAEYVISFIIYFIILLFIREFQEKLIELGADLTLFWASFLLYIPLLWFIWAQGAKRCHDRGTNGAYQFIPFYVLWLFFGEGESGSNQYGEDPWNDQINDFLRRQAKYKTNVNGSTSILEKTNKNDIINSTVAENYSNTIKMIKQSKFIKNLNSNSLSSDEIIIVSVVFGVIVALIFGSVFGETIYYYNNGSRGDSKDFDYNEFHLNYISLFSSFIITSGLSYILLKRKNKKSDIN